MAKSKWDKLLEKYLFLYKDGFFELPYLSNSAKIMVDSVIELPVARNKILEQGIYSNNPFCKGVMYYREIEENFSILATHIDIKENIRAKAIYDENQESNYYILSFSVFEYEFPIKNADGKNTKLRSTCWTFYKPNTQVETYFYKNTKGNFYNFVFDKKWADKNIVINNKENKIAFNDFLDLEIGFYTWLDIAPKANDVSRKMSEILTNEKAGIFNTEDLKISAIELINNFFDNAFYDNRIPDNISLSNIDYAKISNAEKIILLNLNAPFIGVNAIAQQINMSPTKLKSNFKTIYGFSMLQYHKEKNMLLAKQLLENSDVLINHIFVLTGYESASKFTAAFKKRFGKLPSDFR
ncbi:helix-turn-helix domain-containing protein [Flavobacterium sp.]|uniref:helix-turn-helix domain-containing protein n=1 Tax=Flavobacterium sp. TaxID=239 RepID=UPI0037538970